MIAFVLFACRPEHTSPQGTSAASSTTSATAFPSRPTKASLATQVHSADLPRAARAVQILAGTCPNEKTKRLLLARAAALGLREVRAKQAAGQTLVLWRTLADALLRCEAGGEPLLLGWLSGSPAQRQAAIRALGAHAAHTGQLSPETTVALLKDPVQEPSIWFALSQVRELSPSVRTRALTLARSFLESHPDQRFWAIRALGRMGAEAIPPLVELARGQVLLSERMAAIASLSELNLSGQHALLELLDLEPPRLRLAVLSGLRRRRTEKSQSQLVTLARLPVPPDEPERSVTIETRCAAASLLSPGRRAETLLEGCDPESGRTGTLARITAFSRHPDEAVRDARFVKLLENDDPLVVSRALRVLARVPDSPLFDPAMRNALRHPHPGVVLTAGQVLRDVAQAFPARAPSRETVQALKEALLAPSHVDAIATRVSLIEAARWLQVLSLKRALPGLCGDPHAAVRAAAHRALVALRSDGCEQGGQALALEAKMPHTTEPTKPVRLELSFGDGTSASMTLQPPAGVSILEPVREWIASGQLQGSYAVVSRDGHWIQLSDAEGDGYPDGHQPDLVVSPEPALFEARRVGLLQYGADAAVLQLVVSLYDRPDLDLRFTPLGSVEGDWSLLRDGQSIDSTKWIETTSSEPTPP